MRKAVLLLVVMTVTGVTAPQILRWLAGAGRVLAGLLAPFAPEMSETIDSALAAFQEWLP